MGNFGRRVIYHLLKSRGIKISQHKISKILKMSGFRSKYGRKKGKNVYSSRSTQKYIAENIFRQNESELQGKEIWSMDFTEKVINGTKIYICGIISVYSKILIAKKYGYKITSKLAIETLIKGIKRYGVPYMVMTDRGPQFVCKEFYDILQQKGIIHSMSRPHSPVDNRFIETFWKSMKIEIGKVNHLNVEQYLMIVEYYEYYYNYLRPHSSLGYLTPFNSRFNKIVI